jgi:hypothetical protein
MRYAQSRMLAGGRQAPRYRINPAKARQSALVTSQAHDLHSEADTEDRLALPEGGVTQRLHEAQALKSGHG